MPKRILEGLVVNDVLDKTISVLVERKIKHKKYKKMMKRHKKYAVHDPNNQCKIGDKVQIIESRPISKNKHWIVLSDEENEKALSSS